MILLGNKQNSLILLGLFSFSRMEIPVYNLGECTPWDFNQLKIKVILEYGRNFNFIRHFDEFLGGRETTIVFEEIQSVSTSYILKAPSVS